ncbi:uncharacterized protein ATC70_001072 [Mucor velutinosus]|uniref:UDP-N-acetylglucosamine transferase subunit ALG13 n=1 Tax=Mucor velutinosus TaxID=708070 RepID=A0AAN7HUB4_9FUNG|nr:hypothetical protein ATC70_001072 [Mucor velutinosus]
MSLFVTVGSTGFDDLIHQTTGSDFLNALSEAGIRKVVYQFGSSEQVFAKNLQSYNGKILDLDGYKYKASIAEDMEQADVIISHAGAGTILQALRMKNKKLIIVVNMSLMDNHQYQLAQAMHSSNYAICSGMSELTDTLRNINHSQLTPFPAAKPETFASIVDEQMGFAL